VRFGFTLLIPNFNPEIVDNMTKDGPRTQVNLTQPTFKLGGCATTLCRCLSVTVGSPAQGRRGREGEREVGMGQEGIEWMEGPPVMHAYRT